MSDSSTRALGIVSSDQSKSEKIRALSREGLSTADIARALGISYQFAYNVLHSPTPQRGQKPVTNTETPIQVRAQVGEGGRVVIPAALRTALGIQVGDDVLLRLQDGELRVITPRQAIKQAQELVRLHVTDEGRSLSAELLGERRQDVERE